MIHVYAVALQRAVETAGKLDWILMTLLLYYCTGHFNNA